MVTASIRKPKTTEEMIEEIKKVTVYDYKGQKALLATDLGNILGFSKKGTGIFSSIRGTQKKDVDYVDVREVDMRRLGSYNGPVGLVLKDDAMLAADFLMFRPCIDSVLSRSKVVKDLNEPEIVKAALQVLETAPMLPERGTVLQTEEAQEIGELLAGIREGLQSVDRKLSSISVNLERAVLKLK